MDAADYRYSWAWVHFMMHGPEAGPSNARAIPGLLSAIDAAGKVVGATGRSGAQPNRANDPALQALAALTDRTRKNGESR